LKSRDNRQQRRQKKRERDQVRALEARGGLEPPRMGFGTPDDCLQFYERLLTSTGGKFADSEGRPIAGLQFNLFHEQGELISMRLPRQQIRFWDGSVLELSAVFDGDLVAQDYRYCLRDRYGGEVWRIEKHRGHEDGTGRLDHIHVTQADGSVEIEVLDPVELSDVVTRVAEWRADEKSASRLRLH
jgi:hypothetical protein